MKAGDRVVKNPKSWRASEFDTWGAGEGVGVVLAVHVDTEADDDHRTWIDVRWPSGREMRQPEELITID